MWTIIDYGTYRFEIQISPINTNPQMANKRQEINEMKGKTEILLMKKIQRKKERDRKGKNSRRIVFTLMQIFNVAIYICKI